MIRLISVFIGAVFVLLSAAPGMAKEESNFRDTSDPLQGNMIFGFSLPFGEEDRFNGIGTTFTWGTFDHLECRCYFPRQVKNIVADLLEQVTDKGVFTNPYVYSSGFEVWIDAMKSDEAGEELAYGGATYDVDGEQDQCLIWVYDKDEGGELYTVSGEDYPEGVEDTVFPDVPLALGKGKYRIFMQFYVQIKGDKSSGDWSWSESGGGTWSWNPDQGYINVAISKGEFVFVVP